MAQSEDFDEALSRGTERVDRLREAGLKGMETVTLARQAGLKRERGRLSEALGAEHPLVKDLTLRMEDGTARLRALKVEIARAGTVVPKAGAAEWVLHGYVWSADGSPGPDLTVALVNGQGQWLRELSFAVTDARGYFQLRAPVAAALEAFLRVTDRNRAQVYSGKDPVPIIPGRVEYQEILQGTDATRGGVPPEEAAPGGPEPTPDSEKKPRRRS